MKKQVLLALCWQPDFPPAIVLGRDVLTDFRSCRYVYRYCAGHRETGVD
ncbi:hypothetical protein CKO_01678 [Citrobacter koseri ATCC BAA-895]|uniref:Uncharacterized protein n=1 Tax=Citrobacter koseri (strain ATCC BAA-895 / CDC 4225-83 / SGSC4696) TaxID=290338 RepID=A8AH47_CITK8|nr:hypothetical protein CKO_01678 [Citrobacter koseri ATCC BAA-895]